MTKMSFLVHLKQKHGVFESLPLDSRAVLPKNHRLEETEDGPRMRYDWRSTRHSKYTPHQGEQEMNRRRL